MRDDLVKQYHVPIDSYVLGAAFGTDDYSRPEPLTVDDKGTPWSKITSYEMYTECQENISAIPEVAEYGSAFMWELSCWPFTEEKEMKKAKRKEIVKKLKTKL